MKAKLSLVSALFFILAACVFTACLKEDKRPEAKLFYIVVGNERAETVVLLDSDVALYICSKEYAVEQFRLAGNAKLSVGSYTVVESGEDGNCTETLAFKLKFFALADYRIGSETSVTAFGDFTLTDRGGKEIFKNTDFLSFNKTVYSFSCTYKKQEFLKPFTITLTDKHIRL